MAVNYKSTAQHRRYHYYVYVVLQLGILLLTTGAHAIVQLVAEDRSHVHVKLAAVLSLSLLGLVVYFAASALKTQPEFNDGDKANSPRTAANVQFYSCRCYEIIARMFISILILSGIIVFFGWSENGGGNFQKVSGGLVFASAALQCILCLASWNSGRILRSCWKSPGTSLDPVVPEVPPQDCAPRRNRTSETSLSLLRRAGLGPEVQRAFAQPESFQHELRALMEPTLVPVPAAEGAGGETDSGLGASGGTQGLELKLLVVFRAFCKLPWNESFRSRLSSGTAAESQTQPRWSEDYSSGAEQQSTVQDQRIPDPVSEGSELDPASAEALKPGRGRCLIRWSPEKRHRKSWRRSRSGIHPSDLNLPKKCERCRQNPETPACGLCLPTGRMKASGPEQNGSACIKAVVEKLPVPAESCEYLEMDVAGSLAVRSVNPGQVNSNTVVPEQQTTDRLYGSVPSTPRYPHYRPPEFTSGRVVRKYRFSGARSWIHSTLSLKQFNGQAQLTDTTSRTCQSLLDL